jgi:tRNA modification GTPase
MNSDQDTIAAVATPPGRGGVGIVRVSGLRAPDIARGVLTSIPLPRQAVYSSFLDADGRAMDTGIALFFQAPKSFTGEDVLELQGHGGRVVMQLLLQRVVTLGARLARPGEFSQRAFLNGKLDLLQAEAIADLIDSASVQAARSAQRSLSGAFSQCVHAVGEQVIALRTFVESAIDFSEEEVDFLLDAQIETRIEEIQEMLTRTRHSAEQGSLLREGLTAVIAGRPNVGKSSLLNRLAGWEVAIVTDTPGTTRDLLREEIQIDGMPLHVIDTAGLRDTSDTVERHGVLRAKDAIGSADVLLLVVEDQTSMSVAERGVVDDFARPARSIVVRNKVDLTGRAPGLAAQGEPFEVRVSAKTGEGIDVLRTQLQTMAGYHNTTEGIFIARRRHLDALHAAEVALESARTQFVQYRAIELLAEELRQAHQRLGEITGEFTSEDLLDRIFSTFCIGK